jgi:predicted enzyme related to lactoylglutathione lyase
MLSDSELHANVPAADLKRARAFYVDKLGLKPSTEDQYGITFPTPSGSWFQVYETSFAGTGKHTIAQWDVTDLDAEVQRLNEVGISFEHYDMPELEWNGAIATIPGLGRMAWFQDSEGNIMALAEPANA